MKAVSKRLLVSLFVSSALTACGGGGSDSTSPQPSTGTTQPTNTAPTAEISGEASTMVGQSLTLSAQGSSDAEGDSLTYSWELASQPSDSSLSLTNATSEEIEFTPDVAGDYALALTVNDGTADSAVVEITINVEEAFEEPTAVISASGAQKQGVSVSLSGSDSTFDERTGADLTYTWALQSGPEGANSSFSSPNEAQTSFVADVPGIYVVILEVSDATNAVSSSSIEVEITENDAPTVVIAIDHDYVVGTEDYAYSQALDTDSDNLSYEWSFISVPEGSSLAGFTFTKPYLAYVPDVAGDYEIALTVSDEANVVEAETQTMTIIERGNPSLRVGAQSLYYGKINEPILIDFASSVSPTGSELTYTKSVRSGPSGSRPTLTTSIIDNAETEFEANATGTYVVNITATNEEGESVSKEVTIRLRSSTYNMPPELNVDVPKRVAFGEDIDIDASSAADPENDLLSYSWQFYIKPSFSEARIASLSKAKTEITNINVPGLYYVRSEPTDNTSPISSYTTNAITVYDSFEGLGLEDMDEIQVLAGNTIELPGSVYGSLEETDEVIWDLLAAPYNSAETISDSSSLTPSFVIDARGKFVFQLRLLRNGELYDVEHFVVRGVENAPPVANAGSDLTAQAGESLTLDGSASSDTDDTLSYEWLVVGAEGSPARLPEFDDNTSVQPTLTLNEDYTGQLVVRLTVSDGVNEPSSDEILIEVGAAPAIARLQKLVNLTWNDASLPYEETDVVEPISSTAGDGVQIVGSFMLYADNADLTMTNIQLTDLNGVITPDMDIIDFNFALPADEQVSEDYSSDIVVDKDDFVSIYVFSPANTNGQTALIELTFTIKETGETFTGRFEFTS